jgi:hypothetical protein
MTEQLSMFPTSAFRRGRARRVDPPTSHEAARRNAVGLGKQLRTVLALIELYPGHTACELAKRVAVSSEAYVKLRYQISRRASELRADGLIRSGTPRVCTVAHSKQLIWYAT